MGVEGSIAQGQSFLEAVYIDLSIFNDATAFFAASLAADFQHARSDMMKSKISLLVVALLIASTFSAFAAGTKEGAAAAKDYKIGIMTGTVSQNEEEFRKAEAIQKVTAPTASSSPPILSASCRSRKPPSPT
jgi:septal ring-binding cell division protein DamX